MTLDLKRNQRCGLQVISKIDDAQEWAWYKATKFAMQNEKINETIVNH